MSDRFLNDFIELVRSIYRTNEKIPLHEPHFGTIEKKLLNQVIDSTFVSSAGPFVEQFEQKFCEYTGAKYAVAVVNGTAALHIALILSGVQPGNEVITQPLTFVATCNAIKYCRANPVFVDVDRSSLGLSAEKLEEFLNEHAEVRNEGVCFNKSTGNVIRACLPVHTFGHPVDLEPIQALCRKYEIILIEDAAESLGSYYLDQHTGTYGKFGTFSFNGNKIITTGGGGIITTEDYALAQQAKHLTTTARVPHRWDYSHDAIGYNYRMPNLNAALGYAQFDKLTDFLNSKRKIAEQYKDFFQPTNILFVSERRDVRSNYWLNAIITPNIKMKNDFLLTTNNSGIETRPAWKLMNELPMFTDCQKGDLKNSTWLADRVVNIPSSALPFLDTN